jgi:molecular chaperone HscB
MTDYFHYFNQERTMHINLTNLKKQFLSLSKQQHPDQWAQANQATQAAANLDMATLNDAYQTLKDPLRRALHWLDLEGMTQVQRQHLRLPMDFLMQQMEWHERMSEAQTLDALDALEASMNQCISEQWAHFDQKMQDNQQAAALAAMQVQSLTQTLSRLNEQRLLLTTHA